MSSPPNYRGYRFPPEIISHTVWLYHRFTLSLRDIEDLLAERNVIVSYESIRQWCATFGLDYARRLRKRRGAGGDRWFLDEVTVSIQGKRQYLWRAVDQDGDVLDILVQSRKETHAAKRFFRKFLKGQERVPIEMTTDKLRSYAAAKREMMPSVVHCQDKYANKRAEVSHEHTREQERQMRGFASSAQAQRFLSVHGQVHNLFRVGRHLLRAANYRVLRGRAFAAWQEATCVQCHRGMISTGDWFRLSRVKLTEPLQRISEHPASQVIDLTPRVWKTKFAHDPMRSDLALAEQ